MCDKSLVYRSCGPYTSCGISSCFRLLSPSHRQVTHALLTRPPLTQPRRASSVRLECVMHAASVHPEPGSNSLKFVYIPRRFLTASYIRVCLALYYFERAFFKNSKEFSESFFVQTSLLSQCCPCLVVQFSRNFLTASRPALSCPSPRRLCQYTTSPLPCQHLFSFFLKKFSKNNI